MCEFIIPEMGVFRETKFLGGGLVGWIGFMVGLAWDMIGWVAVMVGRLEDMIGLTRDMIG
ncbi:hypothetical protein HDC33_000362 [Sporosarcina sp. JAI121]|nr:hypothetical protein [Sporosarcina sp. JAI121]